MSVGDRVKMIRKANQLNQKSFSETIGVSQGTLSDIESGKCYPSFDTLMSIKGSFSCDLNWLVSGEILEAKDTLFTSSNLDDLEMELLQSYRSLPVLEQQELIEITKIKMALKRPKY